MTESGVHPDIQGLMTSDEQILNIWEFEHGLIFKATATVVATSRRLIVKKKSLISSELVDYTYEHISSVNAQTDNPMKEWRGFMLAFGMCFFGLVMFESWELVLLGVVLGAAAYSSLGKSLTITAGIEKVVIPSRKNADMESLLRLIRQRQAPAVA